MIALIMAGGIGTRFWPLSRKSKPKQFLRIVSEKSMIQMTVDRLTDRIAIEDIYIVTAQSQTGLVKEHLPDLPEANIIQEPFGMNTAPCIGLSCKYLLHKYNNQEKVLVLPADHLIKDKEEFLRTLTIGEKAADKENLVTFGIKPDYPATGYGYIESQAKVATEMYEVKQFKEKPDLETAKEFLASGNFYWNSGMFMWKLETILTAYEKLLPETAKLLDEIETIWGKKSFKADIGPIYAKMPKLPVDIGIMEKAEKRVVIPVDYGWSDVGSWKALYEISNTDKNENVINQDNIVIKSQKNYINTDKFVALIGVDNLVVVETRDAILITAKDKAQKVKNVVNKLQEKHKQALL